MNDLFSESDDVLSYKSKKCCSVFGCSNRACPETHLHRFPLDRSMRKLWQHKCRNPKRITKNYFVCSKHFLESDYNINGKGQQTRQRKKGAVPSVLLPGSSYVPTVNEERIKQRLLRQENRAIRIAAAGSMRKALRLEKVLTPADGYNLSNDLPNAQPNVTSADVGVQVNTLHDLAAVAVKQRSIDHIIDTDLQLNTWTGLPNFQLLAAIEDCILTISPNSLRKCSIPLKECIILVFIKMKLNLSYRVMATIFRLSAATISRIFGQFLPLIKSALQPAVYFQTAEEIRCNLPRIFKSHFPNVRAVLDCSEVPIQLPNCTNCRIATYSHYKSTNTAKFLVAISPSGDIMHISKAYAGKSSDKQIFNDERLIDMFVSGVDAIMVDKGFAIETELKERNVEMIRPSFSRGKTIQFPKSEVDENTSIAVARVHVERAIQRIKIYNILSSKIDHNMLKYLDCMLVVSAAITNLSKPILALDKFE